MKYCQQIKSHSIDSHPNIMCLLEISRGATLIYVQTPSNDNLKKYQQHIGKLLRFSILASILQVKMKTKNKSNYICSFFVTELEVI